FPSKYHLESMGDHKQERSCLADTNKAEVEIQESFSSIHQQHHSIEIVNIDASSSSIFNHDKIAYAHNTKRVNP
ncbi:hypothetical protein HDU79_001515, partial [Rhizoclosmatium sp. JEL0117]